MKRWTIAAVAVFVLGGLTACIPAAPPPSGYLKPVIDSMSVPAPVGPGEPVSIVMQVHDDQAVSGLRISKLKVGDGRTFPGTNPCMYTLDPGADVTVATITVTCYVPTFANNGTWDLTVNVRDDPGTAGGLYYAGLNAHVKFTVVGGTTDTHPPHFESVAFDPPQLHATTSTFTMTTRFSDPAGTTIQSGQTFVDLAKVGSTYNSFHCLSPQIVPVSTDLTDVVWSCAAIPGKASPGVFNGYVSTIDGLGHQGVSQLTNINVVA